ncbi:hypothetical protein CDL12_14553 [Handroanthus impetiginosus]|uniref:Retrotransposon gag domain-containing protein n=1 Tax=Handroanthus impetiginosus TaxID=429701 RepID=A0A2G9H5N3_9LAMI|nr:hypothetical protein CDL12_14553 [Handroanthus impetiginosus]
MAKREYQIFSNGKESQAVPESVSGSPEPFQLEAPDPTLVQVNMAQLTELVAATVHAALEGSGVLPHDPVPNQDGCRKPPQASQDGEHVHPIGHLRQGVHVEERVQKSYLSVEPGRNLQGAGFKHVLNTEVRGIRKEMEELRRAVRRDVETVPEGVAFDKAILAEPIPANFRAPGIPEYTSLSDPTKHLLKFQTVAVLYQYNDRVKCKAFISTLGESAQTWLSQLPSGSIHSFAQLCKLFLHQYATSKHFKKTSFSLFSLEQEKRETLREYIRRFTEAALEVSTIHKEVLANAFIKGLQDRPFFSSLVKKPVEDFDELLVWAEKYVNLKEAKKIKRVELIDKRKELGSWSQHGKIVLVIPRGAHNLMDKDGKVLERSWNVQHLKKYYT